MELDVNRGGSSAIGPGLCRMLHPNFGAYLFHTPW